MKLLGQKLAQCWLDKSLLNLDIFNKKDIPSTRKEAYQAQNFFYRKIKKKTLGWKIGAVAREVQKTEGYDGPVIGKIFADTFLKKNTKIIFNNIPYSYLECEYALLFKKNTEIKKDLIKNLDDIRLFTAIDITSSRYEQKSKGRLSRLVQMYLGIADHGNGGRIIIGDEINDWRQKKLNEVKIRLNINGKISEPFFSGKKRIHPIKSLKVFVNEFKGQNLKTRKNDYLLCGSLIQPYKIKKNDMIKIQYDGLSLNEFKIKIK